MNKAFTLIELLIYLVLLAGLSLLTCGFVGRTYRFMLERMQAHHAFVRLVVAEDVLRRDLQLASLWPADWDIERRVFKQLMMTQDGKPYERWVGYEVTSTGLHRREGQFDMVTKKWIESFVTLVNAQVHAVTMRLLGGQRQAVRAVQVSMLLRGQKERSMAVALRNRVLI